MAGKICTGTPTANAGAARLSASKAFCEGIVFRSQGTAAAYPITGNPHDGLGSEDEASWDAGWTVADDAAPGAITASDAPCCAVSTAVVAS